MAKRKNYPGNFEKRSDAYRWRVCVGGLRYRETFHAANQREAEKMARERYRELSLQAERKRDGFLTGVTVASLFDQFEREVVPTLSDGAQRSYADSLKPLRTYFVEQRGNPPLAKVRAAHVQGYLTWRRPRRVDGRKGNVSNRTLAKDRAVLHRIFSLASDWSTERAIRSRSPRLRSPTVEVRSSSRTLSTSGCSRRARAGRCSRSTC